MKRRARYELFRVSLPKWLRDRMLLGDEKAALDLVLNSDGDFVFGELVICACNALRHVYGHMEGCPLYGMPPAVIVVDRFDPRQQPSRVAA